jgi:hypothetical protein
MKRYSRSHAPALTYVSALQRRVLLECVTSADHINKVFQNIKTGN